MDNEELPGTARVGAALVLFVISISLMSWSSTWTSHRRAIWVFIALLFAAGWWLSHLVGNERRDGQTWPRWLWRLVLTAAVLSVGLVHVLGNGASDGFFFGLALVVTALAWLISELRHVGGWRPWIAAGLLGGALVAFVVGMLVPGGWPLVAAIGLGLLLGEVGTEVLSEIVSWQPGVNDRWLGVAAAVAGCAVIAGALWFSLGFHVHWLHLLLLLLVVAVLVAMASADSDSLVLVGIVAVGLLWANAPRNADMPDAQAPEVGEDYFLVLGDSFISGEGATRYVAGTNTKVDEGDADHLNGCRQAPTAWPVRLAAESKLDVVPSRLLFHACSGAVTENIDVGPRLSETGGQRGPAELALFERDRERLGSPKFVLISVGGNDAGFGLIGKTCVGPGSCAGLAQQFIDDGPPGPGAEPVPDKEEDLASIGDDLDDAYDNLERSLAGAPEARPVPVIVVPYPIPVADTTGSCSDLLLDQDERDFIVHFVTQLNEIIATTAARHGFLYMDTMQNALTGGHRSLCDDADAKTGLNFLALNPIAGPQRDVLLPTNWVHNSFHPNADGHEAMRDAADRWFATHSDLAAEAEAATTAEGAGEVDAPALPTLASTYGNDKPPTQCHPDGASKCELQGWRWSHAQAAHDYRVGIVPVLALFVGMWFLLLWPRWFFKQHNLNLARFLPSTWGGSGR